MTSRGNSILVRAARTEDLPGIIGMLADDELGSTRGELRDPLPACYAQAFEAIDRDPNQFLAVAELDGEMVGTFQLSFIPYLTHRGSRRAQVEAVRVASSARGQGLGAEMFKWAIAKARSEGCSMVQLTSDKQRPEALRFYEGLGFRASHEGFKLSLRD